MSRGHLLGPVYEIKGSGSVEWERLYRAMVEACQEKRPLQHWRLYQVALPAEQGKKRT